MTIKEAQSLKDTAKHLAKLKRKGNLQEINDFRKLSNTDGYKELISGDALNFINQVKKIRENNFEMNLFFYMKRTNSVDEFCHGIPEINLTIESERLDDLDAITCFCDNSVIFKKGCQCGAKM